MKCPFCGSTNTGDIDVKVSNPEKTIDFRQQQSLFLFNKPVEGSTSPSKVPVHLWGCDDCSMVFME